MKSLFIIFILNFASLNLFSQTNHDIYYPLKRTGTADSNNISVSKYGHYFTLGLGKGILSTLPLKVSGLSVLSFIAGYSLAYKSHVVTFIYEVTGSPLSGGGDYESSYYESHFGILLGQSLRTRNFFASINAGIASSELNFINVIDFHSMFVYDQKGIAFPLELKLFLLSKNAIGFGINAGKCFGKDYSPSYLNLCLVFGVWNKR
jgi:hypothetical protein